MDNARINRPAAKADHDKPRDRDAARRRNHQQKDSEGQDRGACKNQLSVSELLGDETAQKPADGDADIEQGSILRRLIRRYALYLCKVGACPTHRRCLRRAVGEKPDQQKGDAPDLHCCRQAYFFLRFGGGILIDLPDGKRKEEQRRDAELYKADDAIAVMPRGSCQRVAHYKGADNRPHAPKAVQPAHVFRLIMQRHIVVQRGVDRPRSQAVRNCKDDQHPKLT